MEETYNDVQLLGFIFYNIPINGSNKNYEDLTMSIRDVIKLPYISRIFKLFCLAMFTLLIASATAANRGGQVLTLNLKGTGIGYLADIPEIDGTQTTVGTCFDVELYDLSTGFQIGTATDCLADLVDEQGGTKLVGTTFFNFTGGASLVTRGETTVMPVLHGSPGFTHVTGAGADGNGILSGTKQYKNASGSVRLSGLVNLSKLGSDGEITFDCLFVINLD